MVDWSTDWLTDWLSDWLTYDWLSDWRTDGLNDGWTDWKIHLHLIFSFQGEEEVTRETLIKNHFTQRIAELSSQVNIRKLGFALLSYPRFVYVTLQSSLPILSSLFSLRTRRSFSKARVGNETASDCEKIRGSGRGNSFFPTPLPSPFLLIFLLALGPPV